MTQMDIHCEKVELAKSIAKNHPILKHYAMPNSTAVVNVILDYFNMGFLSDNRKTIQIPADKIDDYVIFPKEKLKEFVTEIAKNEIEKSNGTAKRKFDY